MRMIELTDAVALDERPIVTVPVTRVAATVASWYGSAASLASDLPRLADLEEAIAERDEQLARDLATVLGVGYAEMTDD